MKRKERPTPQGRQRIMRYTTKITTLEPPREVAISLLEQYVIGQDPARYKTLVPWLVEEEACNRYPTITRRSNRQVTITASRVQSSGNDTKNDPSKKLSAGKSSADGLPDVLASYTGQGIPAAETDKGSRDGKRES